MGNRGNQHRARRAVAIAITGFCLSLSIGCGDRSQGYSVEAASNRMEAQKAEPKSGQTQSVEPEVQTEIGKMDTERRAKLLADAQSALDETRNAIAALDEGDKQAALAALERATGKLDLVVARDRSLALAPVALVTTIHDLYATADSVKAAVKLARDDLASSQVQQARTLLQRLVSEAELQVTDLPLVTYPAAIKAVVPLIDAGKLDEAKTALYAALNTLVVEDYIVPLPKIRAQWLLRDAEKQAAKSNRNADENAKLSDMLTAAKGQLELAEALGYGTADSYRPLYAQIAEIQKQTEAGQSGKGLFARLQDSLKRFKFVG